MRGTKHARGRYQDGLESVNRGRVKGGGGGGGGERGRGNGVHCKSSNLD